MNKNMFFEMKNAFSAMTPDTHRCPSVRLVEEIYTPQGVIVVRMYL